MKSTDLHRLKTLLHQFGCNDREAIIYLHCLELGPASVQQIAKGLRQNRLTTHSAIELLIEKGFLFESRKGNKRLILAEDPGILLRLLQKKKSELEVMHTNIEHMLPILRRLHPEHPGMPSIKFYEEVDGLKKMLEETLTAKGEVLVFSYVEMLAELLGPDYLEEYFARRAKKGIHTRLIFPPCPFAERVNTKAKEYKIRIRLLPESYTWNSGIFAWNDSIALLSYTQNKVTCSILENPDIADFFRSVIFDFIWQQAAPISGTGAFLSGMR